MGKAQEANDAWNALIPEYGTLVQAMLSALVSVPADALQEAINRVDRIETTVGYYSGSWAGAMCPTDDVVAHLMLMRGDEHLFWRRANQHAAWTPQAGL